MFMVLIMVCDVGGVLKVVVVVVVGVLVLLLDLDWRWLLVF